MPKRVGILGLLDAARPGDAQAIGGRGWYGAIEETRLMAQLKPRENRSAGGYGRDGLRAGHKAAQLRSVAAENRERIAMAALNKYLDCRGVQWRMPADGRAICGAAGPPDARDMARGPAPSRHRPRHHPLATSPLFPVPSCQ